MMYSTSTKEEKGRPAASDFSAKTGNSNTAFQFADLRTSTSRQRTLQKKADVFSKQPRGPALAKPSEKEDIPALHGNHFNDPLPSLMARLAQVAYSPAWSSKVSLSTGKVPLGVAQIRRELLAPVSNAARLAAVHRSVHDKTGWTLSKNKISEKFYLVLDQLPANVKNYVSPRTPEAEKASMAIRLRDVLSQLNAFRP